MGTPGEMRDGSTGNFVVRLWGSRGTCPSPGPSTVRYGGNTSCVEVRTPDGALLVLDAGTGIRALGRELERTRDDALVHVFLSHRHGDHVLGLPHFVPLLAHDRPICLLCGNSDAATLRPFLQGLLSPPIFPHLEGVTARLDTCDWSEDGSTMIGTSCRVYRFGAHHPGDAAVLRIDGPSGPAIAYAPDNELAIAFGDETVRAWRDALARELRGVRLLIHDATYTDAELASHAGWGHSSAEEATRFALACEAETLLLFHHHPDRTDDQVDALVERCREIVMDAGARLTVLGAAEGMELAVGEVALAR